MAESYISIKQIMDKIMQHPLLHDISLEQVVDMTISFMRIVGMPKMFEEKVERVVLDNYRAKLPCDYYNIIQIRVPNGPVLMHSADSFFMSDKGKSNPSYKIQGNIIYTSIEKGEIDIAYLSIPIDDNGYPLLPDNSSFTRALELYIKKQWFTVLFDLGKISAAVLQNTQQEYAWAVGDCQTEFNRLTLDQAESLYNSWRSMIIKSNDHATGFKNIGNRQILKI